ncbi:MAG: serine hydroxymethyltransferase [Promethearchaeota archaeon]
MHESSLKKLDDVFRIVSDQERWRGTGRGAINMIASENVLSPKARATIDSDFHHRYAEGVIGHREYQGVKYTDEIEQLCVDLSKDLFGVEFTEVRGISGTIANLGIYYGLCKPGEKLFTLSVPNGAHISFRSFGTAGCRGLEVLDIPFDTDKLNIDLERLEPLLKECKPAMITLGGSLFPFPHPVEDIKAMCEDLPTVIHYDASHVLGLIAGGQFQAPLEEGADIVMGSTHKTFPGPQGALIMTNQAKAFKKIQAAIFPGLTSSHHIWRLPPLAVTLLEEKVFGEAYAREIVENAQALARTLHQKGFFVLGKDLGYTRSHQVVVNVGEIGKGSKVAERLERANLICNKNLIWTDDVSQADDPSGIRLGVQELTRYGMGRDEMAQVGEMFERVLLKGEDPQRVARDATTLARSFPDVKYCFKDE